MPEPYLLITLLLVCLALDIAVSLAKSGLTTASSTRIMADRPGSDHQIHHALHLLTPPALPRSRATLKIAQGIFRFFIFGSLLLLTLPGMAENFQIVQAAWVLLAVVIILSLLEWLAEEQGLRNPEKTILTLGSFTRILIVVLYPVTSVLLALFGRAPAMEVILNPVTEDELKTMVDAGQQEGFIPQGERKMIYSIFQLGDTLAREIMVPRIDITALEVHIQPEEAVKLLLKTGYSRVPVYEENIDNIQGVLYTKDLLKVLENGESLANIRPLLREAYFVPEAKKVVELLAEMQDQRVHMAIVVDEYGGVAGLVTLEDIVEEIVGEIHDEFDQAEELPYTKVSDTEYVFQGRIDLDDFNEVMGSQLTSDDADTLGGYIYNHFGRVPGSGEKLTANNLQLTVEQVLGRRIRKVRAQWTPETQVEGEGEKTNGNH